LCIGNEKATLNPATTHQSVSVMLNATYIPTEPLAMQQAQPGNNPLTQAHHQFTEMVAMTQSVPHAGFTKPAHNSGLEQLLKQRQGGTQAVLCASGALAMQLACHTLLCHGQQILAIGQQPASLLQQVAPTLLRLGIGILGAQLPDKQVLEPLITEATRAIVWASPACPDAGHAQLQQLVPLARKYRLPLIVDHTEGIDQPGYCPLKKGAHIMVAALGGNAHRQIAIKGGTVLENGSFNWGCGHYLHFTKKQHLTGKSHWQRWGSTEPQHNTAFTQWVRQEVAALDAALHERQAFLFGQWYQRTAGTSGTIQNN